MGIDAEKKSLKAKFKQQNQKIVERILGLMQAKGINGKTLCDECGLSHSAISDWKNGRFNPSCQAVILIANFFDVSTDFLLCLTDNPKKESSASLKDLLFYALLQRGLNEVIADGLIDKFSRLSKEQLTAYYYI